MGFGTLFIGYFLLLNITFFEFTDVIAGVIMMLGLYKLQNNSRYFKRACYFSLLFTVFGLFELIIGVINLFGVADLTAVFYYSGVARSILLCILTLLFLRAMHHIARDLEVEKVPLKCQTMMVWTLLFYAAYILFDSQLLTVLLPENAVAICYLILILGSLILPIANLTIIFSCYKWICLPEDLERESKIKFDEPKREEAPQRKGKGKK